jgi:hypothetical protein
MYDRSNNAPDPISPDHDPPYPLTHVRIIDLPYFYNDNFDGWIDHIMRELGIPE